MKRTILAIILVFIVWSILDFVIHGLFLSSTYEATANLWRPMNEMNMPLMYLVTFIFSACFVVIYGLLVNEKSLKTGLLYGGLFGLATGVSMGFGSYTFMPIPLTLAWSWFIGALVEAIVAGGLVGVIMRSGKESS